MILQPFVASRLIRPILRLHNLSYQLSGTIASVVEPSKLHPKHEILQYKEWFRSHVNNSDVILDVGSNSGELAIMIADKVKFVYGVEIVDYLVDAANQRALPSNVKFICADATSYHYEQVSPISVITLSNVLEHIENDQQAIIVIKKLLKKNGRLILTVPAYPWLFSYWDKILMHKRRYTKKGLARIVKKSGLEIEKISFCFSFLLPPVIPFRLIRGQMFKNQKPKSDFIALPRSLHSILFLMSRFEHFLLRYISLPFGLSLVVVAQKK